MEKRRNHAASPKTLSWINLFTTTLDLASFPCTEQFRVWALDLLAGCYGYWHGAGRPAYTWQSPHTIQDRRDGMKPTKPDERPCATLLMAQKPSQPVNPPRK